MPCAASRNEAFSRPHRALKTFNSTSNQCPKWLIIMILKIKSIKLYTWNSHLETIYPQIQKFQQKGGALIWRMVLNQGECLFSKQSAIRQKLKEQIMHIKNSAGTWRTGSRTKIQWDKKEIIFLWCRNGSLKSCKYSDDRNRFSLYPYYLRK